MRRAGLIAATGFLTVFAGLLAVAAIASGQSNASLAPGAVPAAYAPLIDRYGHLCPTLSPPLLAAQLEQESGFDPAATSPAGAQGMAQFLPDTFAVWGVSATGTGKPDLHNPADAIASMANYDCALASQLSAVPGDPTGNMLAGYNAGPYAVLAARGLPDLAETRGYVQRIRELATTYSTGATGTPAGTTPATRGAVIFAYQVLGTPYEWGGTGRDGLFDCSGLTQAAYAATGVTLPRTATQQWWAGPHIPRDQLQPGDLTFYAADTHDPNTIGHVGIYIGGNQIIDAPHPGATVRADPLDEAGYVGAVRPSN